MANEYIDPSGLNYAIPQSFVGNRAATPVQAAQTPAVSMLLPKADEELAHVNGLTDAYYNQYGMLKRFTEEMARKGIDVTKPQYGEVGGGELFKTYLGLEADLRSTSNMLKREKEQRAMLTQKTAEGMGGYAQGFDPTTQVGVEQDLQDIWVPNKLLPEVEEAVKIITSTTHKKEDQEKLEKYRTDRISELQTRMRTEQSPAVREYLQKNINALIEAKPFIASNYEFSKTGNVKDPKTAFNVAKPLLALTRGAVDKDQVTYELRNGQVVGTLGANLTGKVYDKVFVQAKDDRGQDIPGKFVEKDKVIRDIEIRSDGSTWLTFQSTDQDDNIPAERIDNQPKTIILQKLVKALGGTTAANKMIEALIQAGAMDELGTEVDEAHPALFGEQGDQTLIGMNSGVMTELQTKQANVKAAKEYVAGLLAGVSGDEGRFGYGKSKVVPIKAKKGDKEHTFKFTRGGGSGKLYVEEGAPVLGLENNKQYTDQEILEAFEKKGFLNYYLNNPVAGGTPQTPTVIELTEEEKARAAKLKEKFKVPQ